MATEGMDELVRAELHRAIHTASRDYFTWTRGKILYEGIELLIQVYSAQRLFTSIRQQQCNITLYLERPCKDLVPGLKGYIDMTSNSRTARSTP